jgi:hypothetical protein
MKKKLLLFLIGIQNTNNSYINYKKIYKTLLIVPSIFLCGTGYFIYKKKFVKKTGNIPEKEKKSKTIRKSNLIINKNNSNIHFQLEENDNHLKHIIYFNKISYNPFDNFSKIEDKNIENYDFLNKMIKIFKESKSILSIRSFEMNFRNLNEDILNKYMHTIQQTLKSLIFFIKQNKYYLGSINFNFPSSFNDNIHIIFLKKELGKFVKDKSIKLIINNVE